MSVFLNSTQSAARARRASVTAISGSDRRRSSITGHHPLASQGDFQKKRSMSILMAQNGLHRAKDLSQRENAGFQDDGMSALFDRDRMSNKESVSEDYKDPGNQSKDSLPVGLRRKVQTDRTRGPVLSFSDHQRERTEASTPPPSLKSQTLANATSANARSYRSESGVQMVVNPLNKSKNPFQGATSHDGVSSGISRPGSTTNFNPRSILRKSKTDEATGSDGEIRRMVVAPTGRTPKARVATALKKAVGRMKIIANKARGKLGGNGPRPESPQMNGKELERKDSIVSSVDDPSQSVRKMRTSSVLKLGRMFSLPRLSQAGDDRRLSKRQTIRQDAFGLVGRDVDHLRSSMEPKRGKFVIHPDSKWKMCWDWLILVLVLYTALFIPLNVAFTPFSDVLYSFDIVVTVAFGIDIIFGLITGYKDKRGGAVLDHKRAVVHYLKYWFAVEFIAVLPFDTIAIAILSGRSPSGTVQNLVDLFGLFKLPRLLRLAKLLRKIDRTKGANIIRLVELIGLFLLLVHWVACVWFFLGRTQDEGNIFTGLPWPYYYNLLEARCDDLQWGNLMDVPLNESSFVMDFQVCTNYSVDPNLVAVNESTGEPYAIAGHTLLNLHHYGSGVVDVATGETIQFFGMKVNSNFRTQYTTALYWAMTTMTTVGYGDISPITSTERVFVLIMMLLGAVVTAVLFGNISLLINKFDEQTMRYREKLENLTAIYGFYDIPLPLRKRMNDHADSYFNITRALRLEILQDLPDNLRMDVAEFMYGPAVRKVPLFEDLHDTFLRSFLIRLHPQIVLREEYITTINTPANEVFFLVKGKAEFTAYPLPDLNKDAEYIMTKNGRLPPPSRRTLAARGDLIPSVLHKGGRKGAERGDIYICSLLLEGSFFGDMEVLLGVRRLADIKALSNVELLVIYKEDFFEVLTEYSEYMKLFQDNAERRERELRSRLAILEKRAEKKKQKSMSDVYEDMKKSSDDEQPSSSMSDDYDEAQGITTEDVQVATSAVEEKPVAPPQVIIHDNSKMEELLSSLLEKTASMAATQQAMMDRIEFLCTEKETLQNRIKALEEAQERADTNSGIHNSDIHISPLFQARRAVIERFSGDPSEGQSDMGDQKTAEAKSDAKPAGASLKRSSLAFFQNMEVNSLGQRQSSQKDTRREAVKRGLLSAQKTSQGNFDETHGIRRRIADEMVKHFASSGTDQERSSSPGSSSDHSLRRSDLSLAQLSSSREKTAAPKTTVRRKIGVTFAENLVEHEDSSKQQSPDGADATTAVGEARATTLLPKEQRLEPVIEEDERTSSQESLDQETNKETAATEHASSGGGGDGKGSKKVQPKDFAKGTKSSDETSARNIGKKILPALLIDDSTESTDEQKRSERLVARQQLGVQEPHEREESRSSEERVSARDPIEKTVKRSREELRCRVESAAAEAHSSPRKGSRRTSPTGSSSSVDGSIPRSTRASSPTSSASESSNASKSSRSRKAKLRWGIGKSAALLTIGSSSSPATLARSKKEQEKHAKASKHETSSSKVKAVESSSSSEERAQPRREKHQEPRIHIPSSKKRETSSRTRQAPARGGATIFDENVDDEWMFEV